MCLAQTVDLMSRWGAAMMVCLLLLAGCSSPPPPDMDGDGTVEIIYGSSIYNGEDGTIQGEGEYGTGAPNTTDRGSTSFAVDLDGDGS